MSRRARGIFSEFFRISAICMSIAFPSQPLYYQPCPGLPEGLPSRRYAGATGHGGGSGTPINRLLFDAAGSTRSQNSIDIKQAAWLEVGWYRPSRDRARN